jgi:hypothetical protein
LLATSLQEKTSTDILNNRNKTMQEQIQSVKQLLEINNITASQINDIFIKALGDRALWEQCSTLNELACLEDPELRSPIEVPEDIRWILELLWRSRIDLNDARINAEEVDLEEFLAKYDGTTQVAESRLKTALYIEKQLEERDREIAQLNEGCEVLVTTSNDLNRKSELAIEHLKKVVADRDRLVSDRDTKIQELEITAKDHREKFDALKSHFEVTLKAIAMNLNGLKGERKPDHVETVDGVQVSYRKYDDNLTHHGKTLIIENQQRAIAEEAKKLKSASLKDFSFDQD